MVTRLMPDDHRSGNEERLVSAGTLIPEAELRVVDPNTGEDVPTGEQGELWFRTPQLMKGYLNKPEATAEAITPDGWFRTGDIGRVDDGGYVKAVVALDKEAVGEAGEVSADDLITWARERLAAYKCPKTVDFLEALPRNPTGKIMKKDLRKPHWEGRDRATV